MSNQQDLRVVPNVETDEQDLNNRIMSLYQHGALDQAAAAAAECTLKYPDSFFGWKMLGICCAMLGQAQKAVAALGEVVKLLPNDPEAHGNFALALQQAGAIKSAIEEFQRAISINPQFVEAHFNLGNLLKSQANFPEAVTYYESCIHIRPDFEAAYLNLANVLSEIGDVAKAQTTYEALLKKNPNNLQACNNLGSLMDIQGRHEIARNHYLRAIAGDPVFFEAYVNLGDSYRADYQETKAIPVLQQALRIRPNSPEVYFRIAKCQQALGEFIPAVHGFKEAIKLNPTYAEAYLECGRALDSALHYSQEAMHCYAKAIELKPNFVEALHHLAISLSNVGEHEEASAVFLQAIEADPANAFTYHGQFCCLNYHPDYSAEKIYSFYKKYSETIAEPLRQLWALHNNPPIKEKRLKVGYVSPTFYLHSSQHFLEPLLSRHDKSQVEVYAYAQARPVDHVTEKYKAYVDHWIETRGLSDEALSERIRRDGIDILVDIAGHTGHNRLQVFARKPAPVSLHWLDFGYTTGLKAIDYYLTDAETVPEGSEHLFSEKPWRLPVPALVYRPAAGMGDVNALPALERGYVTFGTLTRAVRINHKTIRVWSEILKAVPHSRLVVNSVSYVNPEMQRKLQEKFAQHGIGSERLEVGMSSPPWDVLRGIDIGLDCFPHNSGTTLFETLYMGIPFVTLRDRPSVGRLGASILTGLGHPEWIADTEAGYVENAKRLAQDLAGLSELRGRLRGEMERSALMDEAGFARAVEDAYRQMWERWCDGRS